MRTLRGAATEDDGFSLVEVIVSMVVFAIMSTAVAGLIVKTLQTSGQGSQRQVAANLADSQKEYLLGLPWPQVASSVTQRTVNSATYTVKSTVTFVPDAGGNSCSAVNGSKLTSKAINVTVTWPAMGSITPVRTDTVRPIPMAESGNTQGAMAWQIVDSAGAGLPGVSAALTNSSAVPIRSTTSDANGCILFSDLAAGNYGIVVNQAGYVGKDNVQQISTSATVALGKVSVAPITAYSPIGSVKLAFAAPASNYTVPAGLGAVLAPVDGIGTPQARPTCTSGADPTLVSCLDTATTIASRLFPKSYAPSAGVCVDTGAGPSVTPVTTGTVPSTTIPLGAAFLNVKTGATGLLGPVSVTAIHDGTTSCTSQSVLLQTGVTPSGSTLLRYALPVGTWTIRVANATGLSKDTVVVVSTTVPASATETGAP